MMVEKSEITDAEPKEPSELREPKLLPDEIPDVTRIKVALGDLPNNEDLVSPEPTRDLVKSLEAFGLMQPVVVGPSRAPNGARVVYGGRRRVKAARRLGWVEIDAYAVSGNTLDEGAVVETLTIALNSTAKSNPLAELESIERLMVEYGADEKAIAKASGLRLGTIRSRLKLQSLRPELRAALKAGKLSVANAEVAARLPDERQSRLADTYASKGKLSHTDVDAERRVRVQEAADELDLGDFDTPDYETARGAEYVSSAPRNEASKAQAFSSEENETLARASTRASTRASVRARNHLRGRIEELEKIDGRTAAARWSKADREALRVVLDERTE